EAAKKLENKEIDCLFVTVGMNATIVDELAKQCDIKLLEIDNATSNKLKSAYSYIDCKIPKNTYNGQNTDINTIGIKSVILVSDKLSNDKVKELAKLIFNNAKEIQLTVSADIDITEENAVKGINIPFHKGAIEYYKEKGISVK
ncbi:MAG: TAXI family TRAP transporter solute-binding subunit, partial [Ruminococcaceae bacterium]|nr:TAXI family TRAP transporter solute-binding subunit [Oscillospiraceae bacterium]